MRHFVNYALLFFFLILGVSGILSFFEPFKLLTTRIHIVFGFGVLILVLTHLLARLKYLRNNLKSRTGNKLPSPHFIWAILISATLLAATIWNWWPVRQFIDLGYEARNKAIIFRGDQHTAIKPIGNNSILKHNPEGSAEIRVEIEWGSEKSNSNGTQIAIWAENSTGMMIKTFFVSEECAFSEDIDWEDKEQGRDQILPVWRHRYTLLSGVDPDGNLDGKSAATPEHSFSIEEYLGADSSPFYLYVEVNSPADDQPSAIYGAYIETKAAKEYYLLPLVAHGGDQSGPKGHLFYDLDKLTTAKNIIEKILVRIERNWE